jgi:heme oxygenase (mycobilin-producing)
MEAQMKTLHAILLATAMVAASTAAARAENIVLINLFELPSGGEDAALRFWDAARDFLARQPGYVSARLHRSIAPDARYSLVNVAEWSSIEAFQAATQRMQHELGQSIPEGVRYTPGLYRVIRQ